MNYEEALTYIHGTMKFGWKLGLQNITRLLEVMGNPHHKLKFVHVGGTNGKGSTVAFLSSILVEAGYRVGIYTSPFIQHFTERIKINGDEISQEELARITVFVRGKVEEMLALGENHPTEFEIITAIAFQYYFQQNCDVVVLEVGLGGRFDATNVIGMPLVTVITTISYDHMSYLGNTLPEIAFEKAGIIKGGDVVMYPQSKEVERVFEQVCIEKNALLHRVDFSGILEKNFDVDGQTFDYALPHPELCQHSIASHLYTDMRISLLGVHQMRNAVVALHVAEILKIKGFHITEDIIRRALGKTKWPGRFEVVNKIPFVIIDGAHNEEGARVLAENLGKYFPGRKITLIFGVLKDKNFVPMVEAVVPLAYKVYTVTPESERALPAKELGLIVSNYCRKVHVSDTIEEAMKESLGSALVDEVICAFGSLYFIGAIRDYFGLKA